MKLNKKYTIYILSITAAVLTFSLYYAFNSLKQDLQEKKLELSRAYQTLKVQKKKLKEIKDYIKENNIKPLSKAEARKIILEETDRSISLYDARIVKPLEEKDRVFSIVLAFSFYPSDAEDLFTFINSLKSKNYPVLIFNRFIYENLKEGTKTYFEIKLAAPFK